jgi:hypothetical protein
MKYKRLGETDINASVIGLGNEKFLKLTKISGFFNLGFFDFVPNKPQQKENFHLTYRKTSYLVSGTYFLFFEGSTRYQMLEAKFFKHFLSPKIWYLDW